MTLTLRERRHADDAAAPMVLGADVDRAYRSCVRITRHEAANFFYGVGLLPRPKRWAMSAVYAFTRRVDDIGDGVLDDGSNWRRSRQSVSACPARAMATLATATWSYSPSRTLTCASSFRSTRSRA